MLRRSFALLSTLVLSAPLLASAAPPDKVAPLLAPFVAKHELAGAVVVVANRDGIVATEAVGSADIARKKPMGPDTVFWIASQTKGMTAAALMMLVDEGKVSLDDPVEKHLPEFRGQMVVVEKDEQHQLLNKPARPFTVREALSHTSGMAFATPVESPTLDGLPLAAAVKSYAMAPLQTEPGTKYQYANTGINAAGRIIEVVSGMPYETFMDERLFKPLGMKDTTFWPSEDQVARLAKSYRPNAAKDDLDEFAISQLIYPLSDRTKRFPMPGGGLFSTARDTATFGRMLLNGGELDGKRYLSEASFKELTKRQTPESVKESYGLGLVVTPDWFGHGGAHATNMEIHPGRDLVVVWMVQHAGHPGNGGQAQGVFKNWALEKYGKKQ